MTSGRLQSEGGEQIVCLLKHAHGGELQAAACASLDDAEGSGQHLLYPRRLLASWSRARARRPTGATRR